MMTITPVHNVLTLDDIKRTAPSVFTHGQSSQTSSKYLHISTERIILELMSKGYLPVSAKQSHTRSENKKNFVKHLVRFRYVSDKFADNGLIPEIVLVNSHDGKSSYKLFAGLYRQVCSNGLMAGNDYQTLKITHRGDQISRVIEGTNKVICDARRMVEVSNAMSQFKLNSMQKASFLEQAIHIRLANSEINNNVYNAESLLRPRRYEDSGSDMFSVFNVVQENMIKGRRRIYYINNNKRIHGRALRPISSIDNETRINRELWSAAENFMQAN